MTVQIVEIAGQKIAMLPIADYERLLDLAEDKADLNAAERAEDRRTKGEEYLPSAMVDRLLEGESSLRVWREHRGLTLKALGSIVGSGVSHLSQIERGERRGAPGLWCKLADALGVSADDIIPHS